MKTRVIEAFEPEYNALTKSLKLTLVLDEEAIAQIRTTCIKDANTVEELTTQVIELLERSIDLNTPRKRTGPYGGSW
tara:strand:+ start:2864 stop:3094 length:231 start_codon:yes stop_codon:yes gene_type:complete